MTLFLIFRRQLCIWFSDFVRRDQLDWDNLKNVCNCNSHTQKEGYICCEGVCKRFRFHFWSFHSNSLRKQHLTCNNGRYWQIVGLYSTRRGVEGRNVARNKPATLREATHPDFVLQFCGVNYYFRIRHPRFVYNCIISFVSSWVHCFCLLQVAGGEQKVLSVEELSSMVLTKMKETAENTLARRWSTRWGDCAGVLQWCAGRRGPLNVISASHQWAHGGGHCVQRETDGCEESVVVLLEGTGCGSLPAQDLFLFCKLHDRFRKRQYLIANVKTTPPAPPPPGGGSGACLCIYYYILQKVCI